MELAPRCPCKAETESAILSSSNGDEMNAAERKRFKIKLHNSYHPTGGQKHHKIKKNVLFVTPYPSATIEHELCKFLYAYLHRSGCNV